MHCCREYVSIFCPTARLRARKRASNLVTLGGIFSFGNTLERVPLLLCVCVCVVLRLVVETKSKNNAAWNKQKICNGGVMSLRSPHIRGILRE